MPYTIFPIKIRHLKFVSMVTFKVCFLSKSLLKSPSLIDNKRDDHFCYSSCFLFYFRGLYIHNLTCNVLTPLGWVTLSVSCIIFCYPWFPCKEIKKYSMSLFIHTNTSISGHPAGMISGEYLHKSNTPPSTPCPNLIFLPIPPLSWIN